jgi:hypothetical protein
MELNRSPNIKIQRAGEEMPDFHFELPPAADLER